MLHKFAHLSSLLSLRLKHILLFFFISCMVCLTLQSTLLGISKAGKICKAQNSLNNPFSEEEEHHKEKESDNDVVLHYELESIQPIFQSLSPVAWPQSNSLCLTHVADISVPPPEFS